MKTKNMTKYGACGHKISNSDSTKENTNNKSSSASSSKRPRRWENAIHAVTYRVGFHKEITESAGFCPRCLRKAKEGKEPKLSEDFLKTLTPEQRKQTLEDPIHSTMKIWTKGEAMGEGFDDPGRNRRRRDMMSTFLCHSCAAEQRTITAEVREANQGLCCKDGLKDFLEAFMMREFLLKRCGAAAEARRTDSAVGGVHSGQNSTAGDTPDTPRSEQGVLWQQ
ncbi:hypothetical protein F5884DRAFT_744741 [Xylogone sp. PMI_703]|nr:hypothetical protein F5884DRAFT_744741 [Xylogone sp. PMI_703]